jgi:hypothetical protein
MLGCVRCQSKRAELPLLLTLLTSVPALLLAADARQVQMLHMPTSQV